MEAFTQIVITLATATIIFNIGYIVGMKKKDEERGIHKHWWEY